MIVSVVWFSGYKKPTAFIGEKGLTYSNGTKRDRKTEQRLGRRPIPVDDDRLIMPPHLYHAQFDIAEENKYWAMKKALVRFYEELPKLRKG